jgi:hypothetical protein
MADKLMPLVLLAAIACTAPAADDEEPASANRPATARAGEEPNESSGQAGSGVRLARLPDSRMGDAASTSGALEVDDFCLYLRAGATARYLIASTIPGAQWDAGQDALIIPGAGGGTFRLGDRVALGGSESPVATLAGQWVDPPGPGCDTSRIWVTNSILAVGD